LEETRASSSGQHITVKKRKEKPKTASTSFQLSPPYQSFFCYNLCIEKSIFDSERFRSSKNEFIKYLRYSRKGQTDEQKKAQKPKKVDILELLASKTTLPLKKLKKTVTATSGSNILVVT
jgi:hypothetical protein